MKLDKNAASLALCHARAVLMVLMERGGDEDASNALSAAVHFVEDAKAMVDGEDRREPEPQS